MTRYLFWTGLGAALLLVITCFIPWVTIDAKNIVISGVDASGTNFGKPGYFNLLMTIFFVFFSLIPRVWAKRANLLVVALNLAWAIRNYFLLSACRGGECPEKETGLYLLLLACGLMLASALFPPISLQEKKS
ncbi:MAG TPA: hypothetical protein VFX58_19500 [Chitinophagaceae bacterium]|nr:hypothetical protein [Chitinophagaceae bacterium]